jgi:hypothetical protein
MLISPCPLLNITALEGYSEIMSLPEIIMSLASSVWKVLERKAHLFILRY